jgi:hypothetical protein
MDNLYVSLRHFKDNSTNGLPVSIDRIYTEEINVSKPMQPYYSREWLFYNPQKDGIPVPENLKLPQNLYMICKGLRKINFDFYTQERGEWIVSDAFMNFIKEHKLFENSYEISELNIQTTTGKQLGSKRYFLMRFFQDNNDLVDWDNSQQIESNRRTGIKFCFYKDLCFFEDKAILDAMFFTKIAFKHSFVMTEKIKLLIEKENFLGYDFYKLNDFVEESQRRIEYFNIKK